VNEILELVVQVDALRRRISYEMSMLPERFQRAAPQGLLRLRPWRRRRLALPYAVYWIILNRRRIRENRWQKERPTFPFRRPVIRTRQDLDDAIFFARASKVRRVVYSFNLVVKDLNATHAELSRAIDTVRKRIARFPQVAVEHRLWALAGRLRGFELAFDDVRTALQRLDLDMSILPGLPFRLVFEQDVEHPYGRVRWRRVSDGRPVPALTDKVKRALRIPVDVRRLLTPHERARRQAMARLKFLTALRRRLLAFLRPLIERTRRLFWFLRIELPKEVA
jgi:hypothetical protein